MGFYLINLNKIEYWERSYVFQCILSFCFKFNLSVNVIVIGEIIFE